MYSGELDEPAILFRAIDRKNRVKSQAVSDGKESSWNLYIERLKENYEAIESCIIVYAGEDYMEERNKLIEELEETDDIKEKRRILYRWDRIIMELCRDKDLYYGKQRHFKITRDKDREGDESE